MREVLLSAWRRLNGPERWVKGEMAIDSKGRPAVIRDRPPEHPAAWSLLGVVCEATLDVDLRDRAVRVLMDVMGRRPDEYSDDPSTTHADLMRVFECAVGAC